MNDNINIGVDYGNGADCGALSLIKRVDNNPNVMGVITEMDIAKIYNVPLHSLQVKTIFKQLSENKAKFIKFLSWYRRNFNIKKHKRIKPVIKLKRWR